MYCRDCKWWDEDRRATWGTCGFVDTLHAENMRNGVELVLRADDDQGLAGHLSTGPFFGCIHFMPLSKPWE